ncbi:MAG: type II toxin-antitoxin system VapC family toxin [Acidimicrobiia bacterium]
MRYLLDTHVFLWLNTDPGRLGAHLERLASPTAELLVSAASSWEIAIKYGVGRLQLPEPPARYVPSRLRAIGARPLPVDHGHALAVTALPAVHRDPFDRMLVVQAMAEQAVLVTADPVLARYDAEVLMVAGR